MGNDKDPAKTKAYDPYHRWLGIPPAEQPANHYRLLGLVLYEADPEVIRDAVERQMAHVRTYQLGPHSAMSQQILTELAGAKACLLHPERKAEYDERLRVAARNSEAGKLPVAPLAIPPKCVSPPMSVGAGRRQKLSDIWQAIRTIDLNDARVQRFLRIAAIFVIVGTVSMAILVGLSIMGGAPHPSLVGPKKEPSGREQRSAATVAANAGTGEASAPQPPASSAALSKEVAIDLGQGVKLELRLIPAGSFLMGSPNSDEDAPSDEKPQHEVRITQPFYLGKYELTQEQWEAVMGDNPSNTKAAKHPVDSVGWEDCQLFVRILTERFADGHRVFCLPTESQWEYACRAGEAAKYGFGDDVAALEYHAWFRENAKGATHPVGTKKPNAWGLYDMHGNVWEWCADWYGADDYQSSSTTDPLGPSTGTDRVLRGGGWLSDPFFCRSAIRHAAPPQPTFLACHFGLRVACRLAADAGAEAASRLQNAVRQDDAHQSKRRGKKNRGEPR